LSDQPRSLPDQPNLRYLKLEAKRRLAAGEFATLHDAQLAVAREHGLSSWTVLKETIAADDPGEPSPVLAQVRWLLERYQRADDAGWVPPGEEELRGHFTERFLALVPPDIVNSTTIPVTARLREELVVTQDDERGVRASIGGLRLEAVTEAGPPNRLSGLRMYRLSQPVTDGRMTAPPAADSGPVPAAAAVAASDSLAELGLPGLVLASSGDRTGDAAGPVWTAARGWADLDRPEALTARHRFPAYSITKLVTATTVLRLVADGRLGLDDPANAHLRTVRLADPAVTVRELLSHTGGVGGPDELFGSTIPDLVTLVGPVMGCPEPRGTFRYSNGGFAMLGQLIADVTGGSYQAAAESLVLRPLGLAESSFPGHWPDRDAVTGYELADDGSFAPVPARVCTVPSAGGLWSTGPDLVRFGTGWASLLPAELAREALRPHAPRDGTGAQMGLGWLLHPGRNIAGHAGSGPGAATSLLLDQASGRVGVALANRLNSVEPVNARLLRPIM